MIKNRNGYEYLDRYGAPLTEGDKVRVRWCVGRYGETRTIEGTLDAINDYQGVTVAGVYTLPRFTSNGSKRLIGYGKLVDYEHGHESWIERIDP